MRSLSNTGEDSAARRQQPLPEDLAGLGVQRVDRARLALARARASSRTSARCRRRARRRPARRACASTRALPVRLSIACSAPLFLSRKSLPSAIAGENSSRIEPGVAPDAPERRPQQLRGRQELAAVLGVAVARPDEVAQRVDLLGALLGLLRDRRRAPRSTVGSASNATSGFETSSGGRVSANTAPPATSRAAPRRRHPGADFFLAVIGDAG